MTSVLWESTVSRNRQLEPFHPGETVPSAKWLNILHPATRHPRRAIKMSASALNPACTVLFPRRLATVIEVFPQRRREKPKALI